MYKVFTIIAVSLLVPAAALGAFNTVTHDGSTTVNLSAGTGNAYTLTNATRVESYTVNTDSVLFNVSKGSIIEMTSANGNGFSISSNTCGETSISCGSTSKLTILCTNDIDAQAVTVTPQTACNASSGAGSSGGSSGGGSGPGASPAPAPQPETPAAEAPAPVGTPVTVSVSVSAPTSVSVGSSSHTVTVSSATDAQISMVIQSKPVSVTLDKGASKDIDSDGNGKADLRVTYYGLDEKGNPKLQFSELAAGGKKECALTLRKAYKHSGSSAVYYVTENCTKRPFSSPDKFFSYFTGWNTVMVSTKAKLDSVVNDSLGFMPWGPLYDPQYGALAKIVTDPKVYLLLGPDKYWINSEKVFNDLSYKWDWIEDIDGALLDKYKVGSEINYIDHHPNYTLVKYKNSSKVYRLEPDPANSAKQVKRHIKDEATFKKLKYRWDRIVTLKDSEIYSEGAVLSGL